VKWLGWRNYMLTSKKLTDDQRKQSAPVRIKRGAIEENVPGADLVVSPWHHIFIDDVLVRANDLINGQTHVQEMDVKQVAYFHIELDQFDVVRAHGVFSESWVYGGNRDFFENADVTSLRPEDMKRRLADRPGFTVLRDKIKIKGIQNRLLQRALSISGEEKTA